ncbi:hypothetical protein ADUPG1_009523 [Aduncisulcus paluster]|uniref:Protein kinase domain-containing protein n=1 Tax=Aduncisulcus paluster TaxID=2918883 RepID=A0ABQ5KX26_9EUKA|nr:hypothetical protein ADUPG1_009523 [Aduncisulcus paluster]
MCECLSGICAVISGVFFVLFAVIAVICFFVENGFIFGVVFAIPAILFGLMMSIGCCMRKAAHKNNNGVQMEIDLLEGRDHFHHRRHYPFSAPSSIICVHLCLFGNHQPQELIFESFSRDKLSSKITFSIEQLPRLWHWYSFTLDAHDITSIDIICSKVYDGITSKEPECRIDKVRFVCPKEHPSSSVDSVSSVSEKILEVSESKKLSHIPSTSPVIAPDSNQFIIISCGYSHAEYAENSNIDDLHAIIDSGIGLLSLYRSTFSLATPSYIERLYICLPRTLEQPTELSIFFVSGESAESAIKHAQPLTIGKKYTFPGASLGKDAWFSLPVELGDVKEIIVKSVTSRAGNRWCSITGFIACGVDSSQEEQEDDGQGLTVKDFGKGVGVFEQKGQLDEQLEELQMEEEAVELQKKLFSQSEVISNSTAIDGIHESSETPLLSSSQIHTSPDLSVDTLSFPSHYPKESKVKSPVFPFSMKDFKLSLDDLLTSSDITSIRILGRGGFGEVHLVQIHGVDEYCVLKKMLQSNDIETMSNCVKEFRHQQKLFMNPKCYKRIPRPMYVLNSFSTDSDVGSFGFIMEYCAGGSVDSFAKRWCVHEGVSALLKLEDHSEKLTSTDDSDDTDRSDEDDITMYDPIRLAALCVGCVECLDDVFSAKRSLVHRDIKPQNFLVRTDAEGKEMSIVLGDLGLAKIQNEASASGSLFINSSSSFSSDGSKGKLAPTWCGTFVFNSYEALKEGFHSQLSDAHSLGMTILALFSHELPLIHHPYLKGISEQCQFIDALVKIHERGSLPSLARYPSFEALKHICGGKYKPVATCLQEVYEGLTKRDESQRMTVKLAHEKLKFVKHLLPKIGEGYHHDPSSFLKDTGVLHEVDKTKKEKDVPFGDVSIKQGKWDSVV